MKILFVVPNVELNISVSQVIPLGLAYLASTLIEDGHEVDILDKRVESNAKMKDDYDLVGITATTPLIVKAWEISKEVKEFNPDCKVLLGGPHPTVLPDESLQQEAVDIVVRGEGEETIKEVCKNIEKNETLKGVKGTSYKENGKIIHNINRPFIEDLDKIPFPKWELFDLKKYQPIQLLLTTKKSLNILTSRGCPYNCNFCYKGIFGYKYRMRSVPNLIEEWRLLVEKFKVEEIGIQDDLFNFNKKRVVEFCKELIKEGLDIPWCTPNGIRADYVDKEILSNMKRAGCYRTAYGVENGNQDYLDNVIKKGIKLQQIMKATRITKRLGLKLSASFILGNVGETISTMKQTINFACSLPIDYALFNIATPYPGTRLYEIVKANGKILVNSWEEYSAVEGKCYFEYGGLKKDIVEKMFRYAYRRFYLRPKNITKNILEINNWSNIKNLIQGISHYIKFN